MRKLKKSFIAYTFIISAIFSNSLFAAEKPKDSIKLVINDKIINSEVPPLIKNSRTLVPARAVLEELGASILWVNETREIFISFKDELILLKVDTDTANINGNIKTMDVAPQIINGSTMIPLRFVSEAFGFDVGWDGNNQIVSINSILEQETQPTTEATTQPTTEVATQPTTETTTQPTTEATTQPTTEATTQPTAEATTQPTAEATTQPTTEATTQPVSNVDNGDILTFKSDTVNPSENTTYPIIQNETHNLTDLIGISMPENGNETFKITAKSKMSSIKYDIIQDPVRLYIDIENSISKLDENISVRGSNSVKSIRTSQQLNQENVTRIVFDLSTEQHYDIYMSEDRTTLNVKFKPTVVDKITLQSIDGSDIVNIYGNSSFMPNIMELSNPNRIVIDIPNTLSMVGAKESNVNGNFVSAIRTSQFDANTVRIVLDTAKLTAYEVISDKGHTTIKLSAPTYKNLSYINSNDSPKLILKKDSNYGIDINLIKHDDKYLDGYYKLTLPGNYVDVYGYGNYKINDGYLNFIKIENKDGNTEFIFDEKNVYTCQVTEDEQNIYLNIYNPKSVYKQVVVIDPGHGGAAPGTIQNGLTEKNITLDVGNRLYSLLESDPDIKVYATRVTDVNPSFDYRTGLANHSADMFVSVHCNSISSASVSGVQVFYPNPSDKRGSLSKQLGNLLMDGVTSNTGFPNRPANQSMGYEFKVLRETTVPACLVEMGFLTNNSDASKLATPEGRQQVAQGVYDGIKKAFATIIPSRQ